MDNIHYSRIRVICVSHLCPVEFALHNVHDIFRLKITLVFNFSDACYNFKTGNIFRLKITLVFNFSDACYNFKTGNISSTRHVYAASW